MPLYELTSDSFRVISESSFSEMKVKEREDLQRLLRTQIDVLGDDLYVITEEFGEWEDSRRRIDLLAIDRQARLVVIELKRTSDGGHMELQAIRYAAMVSTMTFERIAKIHTDYLRRNGQFPEEATDRILEFLEWDTPDEENFAQDVRILLVSEDFGKELTTAVLWLRDHEIDIQCIRLRPYLDGQRCLVDVAQMIPLPEAQEYQIQIREKEQSGKKKVAEGNELRLKFWEGLIAICRERKTRHGDRKPQGYHYLVGGSGKGGLNLNYLVYPNETGVELYITRGTAEQNNAIFDQLFERRAEIERDFGHPLIWQRLDNKRSCRIKYTLGSGGFRNPESDWPRIQNAMVDSMTAIEKALIPQLDRIELC